MLTISQVLENNSENENVLISVTKDNWQDFATLLHEQGYAWRSGESLLLGDDNIWRIDDYFNDTKYHLLFITLHSEDKMITYATYENLQTDDFFKNTQHDNYCIIKPCEHFIKEIKELT